MAYISFKPKDYFNTVLWTGTGSEQTISGVGFQSDLTWVKRREQKNHNLFDVVRGATKHIYANLAVGQDTTAETLKSWNTDGFVLGTDLNVNANAGTYAAWNWKAGNSQGSSNTDGTINTTYTSVNTTAGFSISQYTGTGSNATIGHGIGAAPKLVIIKKTNSSGDWLIGQEGLGGWNYVLNFSTSARADQSAQFQSTAPSSSVITLGTDGQVNASGDTYICYAFADVKGFSKFGSYQANNNDNGPFVYTGFKPAFVITKIISGGSGQWLLWDSARNTSNPTNKFLKPDADEAEATSATANIIDMCSNGFKIRENNGDLNYSSYSYIYMAFAEEPLVASNGIPATAK